MVLAPILFLQNNLKENRIKKTKNKRKWCYTPDLAEGKKPSGKKVPWLAALIDYLPCLRR